MPIPLEIQRASAEFEDFLRDAQANAYLTTRNQAYTMVEGVLKTFRARLSIEEAIAFADVLPPVLRAIFVSEWDVTQPRAPFETRDALVKEVQSLRRHHNFAPDTCISDVARALRKHVGSEALNMALSRCPEDARAYWDVDA